MKNLKKALGIVGITALSFLPMNGKGQDAIDTTYSKKIKIEDGFMQVDFKNRLVKKVKYLGGDIHSDPSKHIYEMKFDEKGNMIEEYYWSDHKKDGTFDYIQQTILKYDEKGNCLGGITLEDNEGDGKFDEKWEFNEEGSNTRYVNLKNNEIKDF